MNKDKLRNIHKSLTVWVGAVLSFATAFFGMHPEYLMDIGRIVLPSKPELVRDILAIIVSGAGISGIVYGKTRNAPPLEER